LLWPAWFRAALDAAIATAPLNMRMVAIFWAENKLGSVLTVCALYMVAMLCSHVLLLLCVLHRYVPAAAWLPAPGAVASSRSVFTQNCVARRATAAYTAAATVLHASPEPHEVSWSVSLMSL
jgi:hypothetical protein